MAQYFNFARLIIKYSTTFIVTIPSESSYNDSGDYQAMKGKDIELTGAIISHRESKIFKSDGSLTEKDRALYMLEPLDKSLQGATVKHDGNLYRIGSELENADFTGVYSYTLQFVSVFNEVAK